MRISHIEIRNFRGIKALSWHVKGDFNCIIGAGDTCKTTILTALDYALSPRTALSLDDSDFFDLDVDQDMVIQVTLSGWDETQPDIRRFFREKAFAQYKCGLDDTGPMPEPLSDDQCQRRSKISPPGRSKTSPLNVMRSAVLGGCPGSP